MKRRPCDNKIILATIWMLNLHKENKKKENQLTKETAIHWFIPDKEKPL